MKTDKYAIENLPESNKTIYRHLYRCKDAHQPTLNLAIVCDDDNKMISLLLEPNHFFGDGIAFSLFWKLKDKGILGDINYRKENAMSDYLFATELVKFIDLGFEINYNGIQVYTPQSAQAFIETFEDYNFLLSQSANLTAAKVI